MSCHVILHSHMDTKHGDALKKVGLVASVKAALHFSCNLQQPSQKKKKIYPHLQKYLEPKSQLLLRGELEFLLQK